MDELDALLSHEPFKQGMTENRNLLLLGDERFKHSLRLHIVGALRHTINT